MHMLGFMGMLLYEKMPMRELTQEVVTIFYIRFNKTRKLNTSRLLCAARGNFSSTSCSRL
jgi:hypothetical protein